MCILVVYTCILIGTGKLFDVRSRKCRAKLEGHEGDVSKVNYHVNTTPEVTMVTTSDYVQPTRFSVANSKWG